jgi:hypothetical protein
MKVTSQIHDHDEGPERQKGRRVEDPPAHRKIREQWPDMLRVAGSLVTNQVRAYDLLRMFGREGHPTPLGQAFAEYGRIEKTFRLFDLVNPVDDTCRRRMNRQLASLGLVLNAVVRWNTRYLDAAVEQLRALPADQGEHDVLNEDIARPEARMGPAGADSRQLAPARGAHLPDVVSRRVKITKSRPPGRDRHDNVTMPSFPEGNFTTVNNGTGRCVRAHLGKTVDLDLDGGRHA